MMPTRPETGYGYIAAQGEADAKGICKVEAFKEKPDVETAKGYLAAGNYFWNAGIFVWNADTITNAIRRYAPQIAGVMDELEPALFTDKEAEELKRLFPTCEKISIDYAVMERLRISLCCRRSSDGVIWVAGVRCAPCCRRMKRAMPR